MNQNYKIEIKQLDPIETPIIPFKDGAKAITKNGSEYICEGFQILNQDENSVLIRETYAKIEKSLVDVIKDRRQPT